MPVDLHLARFYGLPWGNPVFALSCLENESFDPAALSSMRQGHPIFLLECLLCSTLVIRRLHNVESTACKTLFCRNHTPRPASRHTSSRAREVKLESIAHRPLTRMPSKWWVLTPAHPGSTHQRPLSLIICDVPRQAQLGYKAQLARRWKSVESFAVSFCAM